MYKIIKSFLIIGLILGCKNIMNNPDKSINKIIDSENNIKNESTIVFQKKWSDNMGQNTVEFRRFVNYKAGKSEPIFKIVVTLKNPQKEINIKDSIIDCPVETEMDFIEESFQISDINNNGFKELSFAYYFYCRGDSQPDSLYLYIIENNKKWLLKGMRTNFMDKMIAEHEGREYTGFGKINKKGTEVIPQGFKKFYEKKWLKYSSEKQIHQEDEVDKFYNF